MDVKELIRGECVHLTDGWIKSVEANLRDLGEEPTADAVLSELDGIRREIWSRAREVVKGDTSSVARLPAAVIASLLLLADAGTNLVLTRLLEKGRVSPDDLGLLRAGDQRRYLDEIGT